MSLLRRYGLLLLLAFVPVAIALEMLVPENHTAIFTASVARHPAAGGLHRAGDGGPR